MASFRYRAVTESGTLTSGVLDADSYGDAVAQVRALGHLPISASLAGTADWRVWLDRAVPVRGHSARAIAVATRELSALLQGRLPLDRALTILAELEETRSLRGPLTAVLASVQDGSSLADALEATNVFPKSYVTMVRAGEMGANLEETLRALADYLARASAIRETVMSALLYPAILLCTAGLSVVFILVFVLPEFAPMFAASGKALPRSTEIVMAAGTFVTGYWWLIIAGVLAAFLAWRRAMKEVAVRRTLDVLVLRLPIIGNLVRKIEIERFSRTLSALLTNGVALPQALLITRDTLSNSVIANAVGETAARLKEGEALVTRLRQTGAFPTLALDFVRVGEETGALGEMLLRQAELYEREIRHSIERLLALLVPLLTILMGALVAGLIASILTAILSINDLAL
ncbi:MAG TPA: type II secretion system F family protein [Rhizomicrobium sp.]|jgi:general secretion pathway protein F